MYIFRSFWNFFNISKYIRRIHDHNVRYKKIKSILIKIQLNECNIKHSGKNIFNRQIFCAFIVNLCVYFSVCIRIFCNSWNFFNICISKCEERRMRLQYEIVKGSNLWKSQDGARFKRIMFYAFRASCCHEPVLSHSPWASILCGKENYGLLRPRRPAPDVSSLVPVIYIRERVASRARRAARGSTRVTRERRNYWKLCDRLIALVALTFTSRRPRRSLRSSATEVRAKASLACLPTSNVYFSFQRHVFNDHIHQLNIKSISFSLHNITNLFSNWLYIFPRFISMYLVYTRNKSSP